MNFGWIFFLKKHISKSNIKEIKWKEIFASKTNCWAWGGIVATMVGDGEGENISKDEILVQWFEELEVADLW